MFAPNLQFGGIPMWRFLAGALACFLMITGAFLLWQGRAEDQQLPPPPAAKPGGPAMIAQKPRDAPEASAGASPVHDIGPCDT